MRNILIIYFFLSVAYAQSQSLFNKIYPKPDWDYSTAVIETNDNSYLIASSSRSQFNSDYDILLMNIDTIGNIIWEKYIGQSIVLEFANHISQTNDGGYLISGTYKFIDGYDTYILKIDTNGDEEWSHRFNPTSLNENGFSAIENNLGEYVIIGRGAEDHTSIYNLSNTGDLNWNKLLLDFAAKQIFQTSDGGYALVGDDPARSDELDPIFLVKTNQFGDPIWTREYEGMGEHSFTITPNIGFLIAAAIPPPVIGETFPWTCLIRTDSTGDTLWTKKHSTGVPFFITNTHDGGYVYSGYKSFQSGSNNLFTMFIVKTNNLGEIEWYNTFDNKGLYRPGNNLTELVEGGYLLTGHTVGSGIADIFLIKFDADGNYVTGINQWESNDLNFEVYPNPTKDKMIISIAGVSNPNEIEIYIYDEFGRLIKTFKNLKSNSSELNINQLSPGIYIVKIFGINNEKESSVKKIVIIE